MSDHNGDGRGRGRSYMKAGRSRKEETRRPAQSLRLHPKRRKPRTGAGRFVSTPERPTEGTGAGPSESTPKWRNKGTGAGPSESTPERPTERTGAGPSESTPKWRKKGTGAGRFVSTPERPTEGTGAGPSESTPKGPTERTGAGPSESTPKGPTERTGAGPSESTPKWRKEGTGAGPSESTPKWRKKGTGAGRFVSTPERPTEGTGAGRFVSTPERPTEGTGAGPSASTPKWRKEGSGAGPSESTPKWRKKGTGAGRFVSTPERPTEGTGAGRFGSTPERPTERTGAGPSESTPKWRKKGTGAGRFVSTPERPTEGTGAGRFESTPERPTERTGAGPSESTSKWRKKGTGARRSESTPKWRKKGTGAGRFESTPERPTEGTGAGRFVSTPERPTEGTGAGPSESTPQWQTQGTAERIYELTMEWATQGTAERIYELTMERPTEGTGAGPYETTPQWQTQGTGAGPSESTPQWQTQGTGAGPSESTPQWQTQGTAAGPYEATPQWQTQGTAAGPYESTPQWQSQGTAAGPYETAPQWQTQGTAAGPYGSTPQWSAAGIAARPYEPTTEWQTHGTGAGPYEPTTEWQTHGTGAGPYEATPQWQTQGTAAGPYEPTPQWQTHGTGAGPYEATPQWQMQGTGAGPYGSTPQWSAAGIAARPYEPTTEWQTQGTAVRIYQLTTEWQTQGTPAKIYQLTPQWSTQGPGAGPYDSNPEWLGGRSVGRYCKLTEEWPDDETDAGAYESTQEWSTELTGARPCEAAPQWQTQGTAAAWTSATGAEFRVAAETTMTVYTGLGMGGSPIMARSSGFTSSAEKRAVEAQKSDASLEKEMESLKISPTKEQHEQRAEDESDLPIGRGGVREWKMSNPPMLGSVVKTRPEDCLSKKGISGVRVQLIANYFKVETVANWVIFQYRVDFNIEDERVSQRKKWLAEHEDKLGGTYIFDGCSLYMSRRLTQDNSPVRFTSLRESDGKPVLIDIRLVQELNYGNCTHLQIFNILMRRALSHLKLQLVNRDYYDPDAAIKISKFNVELWPGYITSIRQSEYSILMCSEISHKVMRLDTAWDLLNECRAQGYNYRHLFQQAIIGRVVLTDYNNKTYRVDDVDFSITPESQFLMNRRELITYVDYYRTKYGIIIRDLKQPMLVSKSTGRTPRRAKASVCILVPELCRMTGLSEQMLQSNDVRKGLADETRINPAERMKRLLNFIDRLHDNKHVVEEFQHWDMKLSRDLLPLEGRELDTENIIAGKGKTYNGGRTCDWTKSVRSYPMLRSGVIRHWAIITPEKVFPELRIFVRQMKKAADGMHLKWPSPLVMKIDSDRSPDYLEAAEEIIARDRTDFLMFVFPNFRSDRYNAIKKKCYVDRGVPSQVVIAKSMRKGMPVATKILIQINCKIGGAPWTVELPFEGLMVVGYDACHDTCRKGCSYGGMVASLNQAMSAWYSAASEHANGEELSNTLASDIGKALEKYQELNKALPKNIFVYRDGVGEGQIQYVHQVEVSKIKAELSQIYGGDNWKLTFIIVSKRIHTRLFKGTANPVAGTIVDDVITLPDRYDFYLVSQNVNCGTVTPTNYNVISDNSGLTAEQLQRLTFKLTHMYYNWTGTIRVPAPCQYAHKLAFLMNQSLRMKPHHYLENTLYFL